MPCAYDQPIADFEQREERVLKTRGRRHGDLASSASLRGRAAHFGLPRYGVHTLNAVPCRRKPRLVNSRSATVVFARVRLS
jgi:hypothetical protein